MSERIVLSGGDAVLYEGVMHDSVVIIDGAVIESVLHTSEYEPRDTDRIIPCSGTFVCPGFIDLHNQGGGGYTVMEGSAEHINGMCRAHAAHGTTGLLLTPLIERDTFRTLLPKLGRAVGSDTGGAAVLGIHAEGPFVNPGRLGCMHPGGVSPPDQGMLDEILDLSGWTIAEMTIAPELPGALDLILALAGHGVVPSLGHSDATLSDVLRAIDCGASHVTHMFNAMSPFEHREPGLAGAALYSPDLSVELIADGFHLHPWTLGFTVHSKGVGRTCLITDCMSVMGLDDGEYESLGCRVKLDRGRLSLADDPYVLAGSVLTMDRAVANMTGMVGFSISDAVAMATASPAAVLGLDDRKGRLEAGYDADIAVLDRRHLNRLTIVGGRIVYDTMDGDV